MGTFLLAPKLGNYELESVHTVATHAGASHANKTQNGLAPK
jgi:hypothetical protein